MSSTKIASALREELHARQVSEEAETLAADFSAFIAAAWPTIKPQEKFQHNWHIDEIAKHLEAVSRGEIDRLQIWIPPGMMKSSCVSVFWHPWEWATRPWLRYWSASYETRLAGRLSAMSRTVVQSPWYQERWGHRFELIRDAEHYWGNDQGGTRLATAPESTGSGEHGHRILIDDPINAKAADATSKVTLETVKDWYDGTVVSRGIGQHARVIIMQRLHTEDLAGHVLEMEDWEVLCLPERYEHDHPYAYRGDHRRKDGELLWPTYRTEHMSTAMAKSLAYRAAGQLQQRPAAREGQILKRNWWRSYHPKLFEDPKRRPKLAQVVMTVDTPLKDKQQNDNVAIQAWGVKGADRYLLELRKGKMNYGQAKRAILEQAKWVRAMYPRIPHYVLIENAGYGVELIVDLKRLLTGVTKISAGDEGNKVMRAENASDVLESGNCFLPGFKTSEDEFAYFDDGRTAADIIDFIESCALFPNATHDDDVDAWSQCMNWLRSRPARRGRTASAFRLGRERAAA